jgi:DEAD/DEAH box helicase domain-containing protein
LLNHLRCAAFELPFQQGEMFGALLPHQVQEFLDFLTANREIHAENGKYYWMADQYPAANVSLRSASARTVVLQTLENDHPQAIGTLDLESAVWMAHPGAIYLHEAQQFFVEKLDLDAGLAILRPHRADYYTEPLKQTTLSLLDVMEASPQSGRAWGEVQVTTHVTGFRKKRWLSNERLGEEALSLPPNEMQTTAYWLTISPETVRALSADGLWTNAPNDYGPDWQETRQKVRARDQFTCQVCGAPERGREHDVHHKIPFRTFRTESGTIERARANQVSNLVTLCRECHRKVETAVRVRSGMAGLGYALAQLAPLFLMCDPGDLGLHIEPETTEQFGAPAIALYDMIPAGIGFSQKLYEMHETLLLAVREHVRACPCEDGCPSCVGVGGENGMGSKREALAILEKAA